MEAKRLPRRALDVMMQPWEEPIPEPPDPARGDELRGDLLRWRVAEVTCSPSPTSSKPRKPPTRG